ncbi:GNAT family N-acetyltransferase [Pararhizobium sp. DWP3-4]|uniref:GNAT family N-acetyltransferase n=1 Tax=unclassified Pararhizobium TaxID=2643050 RepID=UPI003CF4B0B8
MEFLKATQQHDDILIEHCLAVWDSYATPAAHFNVDPKGKSANSSVKGEITVSWRRSLRWTATPRQALCPAKCICYLIPRAQTGSSLAWLHLERLRRAELRRQGISRQLTQLAVDYPRLIGCTAVVLHASNAGEPAYASLGFKPAKEMRLTFS